MNVVSELLIKLQEQDDSRLGKSYNELLKLANSYSIYNIKNLIKRNKLCKPIIEMAADAGIEECDYLDIITCGEDYSCMENQIDLKLIEEAMPEELVGVWRKKREGYSIKEIANELKLSIRTH